MPAWTRDQAIAFEAARECITHLMAIYSAEIHDEESKGQPSPARLAELERELDELARARSDLHVHDDDRIATIRSAYGARVRAHLQQPRQEPT